MQAVFVSDDVLEYVVHLFDWYVLYLQTKLFVNRREFLKHVLFVLAGN